MGYSELNPSIPTLISMSQHLITSCIEIGHPENVINIKLIQTESSIGSEVAIRPEALRQLSPKLAMRAFVAPLTRRAQLTSWRGSSLKKKVLVAYRMSSLMALSATTRRRTVSIRRSGGTAGGQLPT